MSRKTFVREPARDVPIAGECDVLVCGGGPAGTAAAIAAARNGARVILIESNGCLGGTWTAGRLAWLLDYQSKTGLMAEIIRELEQRGAIRPPVGWGCAFDIEIMKQALDDMCAQAGVRVQLNTNVAAAIADDSAKPARIDAVVTESKSGRQAWRAKVCVDATGDGDLAALAGCGFDRGREPNELRRNGESSGKTAGEIQPMSLLATIAGIRLDEIAEFLDKCKLLDELRAAGVSPSYERPTLFALREDLFFFMANHEYGVRPDDAQAISEATRRARAEVHRLVNALRARGGVWQDIHIVAVGDRIGVREGRRIHGRYKVNVQDMLEGARHEDAICCVTFPIDVHSPDPSKGKAISKEGARIKPYDIPLRALIAEDYDYLLMAGRCISGDFLAHSSYRVAGNAVAMGQAAGTAAALAGNSGIPPHEVRWQEVSKALGVVSV